MLVQCSNVKWTVSKIKFPVVMYIHILIYCSFKKEDSFLNACDYVTWTHVYRHTHIHTCVHIYMQAYIHIYIHIYMHACIHTYIHASMHTYIHACIHTYIHIYMHAYNITFTKSRWVSLWLYIHSRMKTVY